MFKAGVAVRTSLINLIYKKSLRLSTTARRETTVGQIVNIMQENTQIFADASFNFLTAISAPYQVVLAVFTLYLYLDDSAFVTLGVMILIVPITMFFSILLKVIDTKKISVKDSRVKLLNEVLNGIKVKRLQNHFKFKINYMILSSTSKVLKLYGWELSFQDMIQKIRTIELKLLKNYTVVQAIINTFFNFSSYLVNFYFIFINSDMLV